MKKMMLILAVFCSPLMASADDDQFYTIIYDEKPQTNTQAQASTNLVVSEQDNNISKSIIKKDLDKISYEIELTKRSIRSEISRFKYSF